MQLETYQMTVSDMEDFADQVKSIVAAAISEDNVTDFDEWSKTHTVILKKRNWFRSAFSKRENEQPDLLMMIVEKNK